MDLDMDDSYYGSLNCGTATPATNGTPDSCGDWGEGYVSQSVVSSDWLNEEFSVPFTVQARGNDDLAFDVSGTVEVTYVP